MRSANVVVVDLLGDLDRLDEDLFAGEGDSEAEERSSTSDEASETEDNASERDEDDLSTGDDEQIMSEGDMEDFFTDEEADGHMQQGEEEPWGGIEDLSRSSKPSEPVQSIASTSASRYVPPALRKQQEASAVVAAAAATDEPVQDPRLRRQLLGLLNRLSPTSFPTLVLSPTDPSSLHGIYLSQSRAMVNSLLSSLILEIVLSQGDGLGETQAVVLAGLVKLLGTGLVGGMNASGGKEVAASVLDSVIKALDRESAKQEPGAEEGGKKRLNLFGFLAELYNIQVVAAGLVYDVVKELISAGLKKEGDVEALLRVLRQSGPQLRHDDPSALKQIVQLVQEQQKQLGDGGMSVRTKFMIETLTNLKNNKVKAPTGVAAEAAANLKRYVSNLAKKNNAPSDPLRVSLEDLRASGTKGKWWLVGAAWSGNPLVDRQDEMKGVLGVGSKKEAAEQAASNGAGKEALLLKLAKRQGMSTDVRRRIFVAVMSSEVGDPFSPASEHVCCYSAEPLTDWSFRTTWTRWTSCSA